MEFIYSLKLQGKTIGEKKVSLIKRESDIFYRTELYQLGSYEYIELIMNKNYHVKNVTLTSKTGSEEKKFIFNKDGNIIIHEKFFFDDTLIFALPQIYEKEVQNYFNLSANQFRFGYMKIISKENQKYNILLPEYSYVSYDSDKYMLLYYENLVTGLTIERQ